jgi:hypothetical protein
VSYQGKTVRAGTVSFISHGGSAGDVAHRGGW